MKGLKQIWKCADGSEIAEMAMVLPVMFLTFLGIFWMGRAYNIYATVNSAAREGARAAIASTCASCGNTAPNDTAVATTITNYLQADHLDTGAVSAPNPAMTGVNCISGNAVTCPVTNNIAICRNVALSPPTVTPQVCGVAIGFQYRMLSTLPMLNAAPGLQSSLQNMQINAHAQMVAEQ